MADVGTRAVHGGLHSLRAQALWLGTSTKGDRADALSRYANGILVNSASLFGGRLSSAVAKAASNAHTYAAITDGFIQASLGGSRESSKRRFIVSPPPFHSKSRWSSNRHSKSSSKKRLGHTKAPCSNNRQSRGSRPRAGPKTQQRGKWSGGRGTGGKGPQGLTLSLSWVSVLRRSWHDQPTSFPLPLRHQSSHNDP